MSSKGIYTALSGAMAQSQRLDTIANNLANSNTSGFKKDNVAFREYLTTFEQPPDVIQVPRVPASVESFYDMQAADRGYVDSSGSFTDQSQGSLIATGNNLDVAIEGDGFFEVLTPQGIRYSRAGHLRVDSQGMLVNQQGFPVLKSGTGDPSQRLFNIKDANVTVSYSGDVFEREENLGKLSVVNFDEKEALAKEGSMLYVQRLNFTGAPVAAKEFKLHQGFLEASNVNIVQEMTDMIAANRIFETNQKAIKAYDSMDEKLYNEVPKVKG